MRHAKLAITSLVCGCAAPDPAKPEKTLVDPQPIWRFDDAAPGLRTASCGPDDTFLRPEPIQINAEPVDLGPQDAVDTTLSGLAYVGGWALTSDDDRFGGLSGLDSFRSGSLLAVSDAGAFVWIGLKVDADFEPEPLGYIAQMRAPSGQFLSGKRSSDSEGLALRDGLAIVSFERDHRVAAFDLEGCGALARSAPVAEVPARGSGLTAAVPNNNGAEAAALTKGGAFLTAIEFQMDSAAPLGVLNDAGGFDFSARIDAPPGLSATGFDALGDTLFSVHRFYAPGIGNRIAILAHDLAESPDGVAVARGARTLAMMDRSVTVDNFEGLAAVTRDDGGVRLFIISDDNFSTRQRTLLMAFDVQPPKD